jgi:acetolactate synthase-1/3 small subunit
MFISCELSLIKVNCQTKQRAEIMKIVELMHAQIVDVATTSLTIQLTDNDEHTQTLISLLKPYGIKEIVRAGTLAIEKGPTTARKQNS